MTKAFLKQTGHSAATQRQQSIFRPSGSPGYAERPPPFFPPAPAPTVQTSALAEPVIQREPDTAEAIKEKENSPLSPLFNLKTAVEHSKIPFALSLSKDGRDFGMLTKWVSAWKPFMLRQAQHERRPRAPTAVFRLMQSVPGMPPTRTGPGGK